MAKGLYSEETLERTEYVQEIRKRIIDELAKDAINFVDGEQANTLLSALRDYEKQELHKDKLIKDTEENDKDRAIAQDAINIANELRLQRRNKSPEVIDPYAVIPEMDESISAEVDELAASERKFKSSEWSDFRKKMITEGHDPRYTVDEEGNIVPRKSNDEA